jgi:hypothetical protein
LCNPEPEVEVRSLSHAFTYFESPKYRKWWV